MRDFSPEVLADLKARFPMGCRVELVRMDDPYAPPPGTRGKVWGVDSIGTIHVWWDNGSSLGVAYGEDLCRRVDDDRAGEGTDSGDQGHGADEHV